MLKMLRIVILAVLIYVSPPFLAGGWYVGTGNHLAEQCWLDRAVNHLYILKWRCHDPDLEGVLDYTIRRYHRIGAWDVMVMPLIHAAGINLPFCPGLTLDPEVMSYPIHAGAMILVHEALHDYFPYYGHSQVTPRIDKLETLWHRR